MRLILTIILSFGFSIGTRAQDCTKYTQSIKNGKDYLRKEIYDKALIEFQAAQIAARECGLKTNEPADSIGKIFIGIQKQRDNAIKLQQNAEKAQKEALESKKEAFIEKSIAQSAIGYFFTDDNAQAAWMFNFTAKKYGVLNRKGQILGDGFTWDNPIPFNEFFSLAYRNDSLWFVNDSAQIISNGYNFVKKTEFPYYYYADDSIIFYNGRKFETSFGVTSNLYKPENIINIFPFISDRKYGFVNKEGKVCILPVYDSLKLNPTFSDRLIAAKCKNKWDIIDIVDNKILNSFTNFDEFEKGYKLNDSINLLKKDRLDNAGFTIEKINSLNYFRNSNTREIVGPFAGVAESLSSNDKIFTITNRYNIKDSSLHQGINGELVTERNGDSITYLRVVNPKTGLFLPLQHDLGNNFGFWGNSIICNSPNDVSDPKDDFSILYDKDGKPFQFFGFNQDDLKIKDSSSGIMESASDGQILSIFRNDMNRRLNTDIKYYYYLYGIGVYEALDHKGLVKSDGSIITQPLFDEIESPTDGKFLAKINGKYGFIDTSGWILPFEYDFAFPFINGKTCVQKKGRWEFINYRGEIIRSLSCDSVGGFYNNLYRAKSNGKWGCIDTNEHWVIKPLYEHIGIDNNGVFIAKNNNKSGYIYGEDSIIHPLTFDDARSPADNGWARIKIDDKWGFFNVKTKEKIDAIYDTVTPFAGNHAWIKEKNNSQWEMINDLGKKNQYGKEAIDIFNLDNGYSIASDSVNGTIFIDSVGDETIKAQTGNFIYYSKTGKVWWNLKRSANDTVVLLPRGELITSVIIENNPGKFDYYQLINTEKNGIANSHGETVLKGNFEYKQIGCGIYEVIDKDHNKGYAAFTNFGFRGETESKQIKLRRFLPPKYDEIGYPIDKEFMPVKKNGKWGFVQWKKQSDGIDTPVLRIPCKYDEVVPFIQLANGKVALVKEKDKLFYINENDEAIINIFSLQSQSTKGLPEILQVRDEGGRSRLDVMITR